MRHGNAGRVAITCLGALMAWGGLLRAGEFTASVNYAAGSAPTSVAVGDFNHDGIPDLAVSNFNSNNVSVLLGNGDGTFKAAVNYGAGVTPSSVAVGDFNGDGNLDLAVANTNNFHGGGNVSILLGNGDGTFQAAVNYSSTEPFFVVAGDLNNDGKLDLAVANHSGDLSVLLGNGDGTFQTAVNYPAGSNPQSVVIGDFNGDGKPDLAVPNKVSNNVSIFIGNGDGTFQAAVNYAVGTSPSQVTAGDFNGDGKLDLAVANNGSDNVSVLMGNGDGTFQPATTLAAGAAPMSCVASDFNGDSKIDLVVSNVSNANVGVYLGNGDGTFQAAVNYGAGGQPKNVAVADLNADHAVDLAVADNLGGVSVLLNTGGTLLSTTSSLNPSNFGQAVTFTTTVTASIAGSGTPSGTVTFLDGSSPLGTSPLVNGQASFATSGLSIGAHTIGAQYSGDSTFNPNSAPPLIQTVLGVPAVMLSPTSLTFALQLVGSTSPAKTVTLTNTGSATLAISSIATSGDFGESNTCGSSLAAGASCRISVTFTPTAPGTRAGSLTITDNASNSPQQVPLTGVGTVVKLVPRSLNFGSQKVGTTSPPKTVTLTNIGGTALSITSIRIGGTDAGDFAIATNTCGSSVGAGQSCTISVTFTPKATGARTGSLSVADNGGGSPQRVSLSGTGN